MPFYDLRCIKCNKEHNIHASMSDKTENRIPCPDCGSLELETVYNGAPGIIKGVSAPPSCPNRQTCGGCHG